MGRGCFFCKKVVHYVQYQYILFYILLIWGGMRTHPTHPPAYGPVLRRRGVVVSGVHRVNEVNAGRARLVPGWVTVFGRVYHLGM